MQTLDDIQAAYNILKNRCDEIDDQASEAAIVSLRQIEPNLPRTREAFHLAHNWLVCQGNVEAKAIIDDLHQLESRFYDLKKTYWSFLWEQVYPSFRSARNNIMLTEENAKLCAVYNHVERADALVQTGNHCVIAPEGHQPTHLLNRGYCVANASSIETELTSLFGRPIEEIAISKP